MAAAKAYGAKDFNKLDPLTVSMTPPDATVALLKGGAQISAAFSVPPFQYQQLEDPAVHTVLNSFDVMGGSHTFTAVWTPAKFRDEQSGALQGAGGGAQGSNRHRQQGQEGGGGVVDRGFEIEMPLDMVAKIVAGPQVHWTLTPENTMKYADFMSEVGTLKDKAGVVEGLFLPGDLRREGKLNPSSSWPGLSRPSR